MALTSRLLRNLYGSSFPQNITIGKFTKSIQVYIASSSIWVTGNDDKTFVPVDLTGELLAQTWYFKRFINAIR